MESIFDSGVSHPCKQWMSFKAGKDQGYFEVYDSVTQEKTQIDNPIHLIPLFGNSGVEGFNKKENKGFSSNEVKSIKDDILKVKLGGEDFVTGKWEDICDKVRANKGKYCKVLYFAMFYREGKDKDSPMTAKLVNIKLSGAALNSYINAKIRLSDCNLITFDKGVLVDKDKDGNSLEVPYYQMGVEKGERFDNLLELAMPFANQMREYFEGYFNKISEAILVEQEAVEEVKTIGQGSVQENTNLDLLSNAPVDDLDELPF